MPGTDDFTTDPELRNNYDSSTQHPPQSTQPQQDHMKYESNPTNAYYASSSNTSNMRDNDAKLPVSMQHGSSVSEMSNPLITLANSVPQSSSDSQQDWSRTAADMALRFSEHGQMDQQQQHVVQQQIQQHIQHQQHHQQHQQHQQQGLPPNPYLDQSTSTLPAEQVPRTNVKGFRNLQKEINIKSKAILSGDSRGPKVFTCPFGDCGKVFSRKMNLNSHINSSHEHKKPFACSVCNQYFARHSDRRRHEQNQHKDGAGYICGGFNKNGEGWGCGKNFKRKDGLTAHWRSQKAKKKCLKGLNEVDFEAMLNA